MENNIFPSRCPEKMVFPKISHWTMIFLVLSWKMIFLLPENMILPPRQKIKDDLSKKKKKNTHMGIWYFLHVSWQDGLFKKIALEHDLCCITWKDGIFSRKYDIFSLGGKWKMIFSKKYMEIWYFYIYTYRCHKHDVTLPCQKKWKMILPRKNSPNGDWRPRFTP